MANRQQVNKAQHKTNQAYNDLLKDAHATLDKMQNSGNQAIDGGRRTANNVAASGEHKLNQAGHQAAHYKGEAKTYLSAIVAQSYELAGALVGLLSGFFAFAKTFFYNAKSDVLKASSKAESEVQAASGKLSSEAQAASQKAQKKAY